MKRPGTARPPYSAGARADAGIRDLFRLHTGAVAQPHLEEVVVTALKLAGESVPQGDQRLVSAALKELRHAFRVFAPWRDRRKVSIFGSARTPRDHPWS